jgi:hypothetical protein
MTEVEWLACEDPHRLLEFLGSKVSERKRRLLAVACCRRIWHLLQDEWARRAVDLADLFADDRVGQKELDQACAKAWQLAAQNIVLDVGEDDGSLFGAGIVDPAYAAAALAAESAPGNVFVNAASAAARVAVATAEAASKEDAYAVEFRCQAALIRDIFGDPFRPVQSDPLWLEGYGGLIPQLARAIYEERRFEAMPSMAGALRDVGCANEEILAHCYSPTAHVRGCWLLDEILGRR